jgi:hypothetical protein
MEELLLLQAVLVIRHQLHQAKETTVVNMSLFQQTTTLLVVAEVQAQQEVAQLTHRLMVVRVVLEQLQQFLVRL